MGPTAELGGGGRPGSYSWLEDQSGKKPCSLSRPSHFLTHTMVSSTWCERVLGASSSMEKVRTEHWQFS